jgi:hypothetical protein
MRPDVSPFERKKRSFERQNRTISGCNIKTKVQRYMKLPRLVEQNRISSPKSNIFSEKFDFAVSLMFLKPNVKSNGVLKAKGKKKNAHHSLQWFPRSIWSSGGVAAQKRRRPKKLLETVRFEVRSTYLLA